MGEDNYWLVFRFKLHLVINHKAEIVAFKLTSGNVDDRVSVPNLLKNQKGKVYAAIPASDFLLGANNFLS